METFKNDAEVASAKAGNNTADKTTGLDYSNMDLTVRPGDDFFRYATGNWIQNNPQPPIFPSWGSFVKLDDDNTKQIAELIQGIAAEQHEPGTVAQKIADLYNLMMDSERLNKEGFSAIQPFVDKINAISSREELLKMMATEHRNLLFGIGICPDEKNSNFYIIGVGQGGLSLGNRDYYLSDDPELVKVREAFKEHVVNVYKLTGATEEVAQAKMENLLKYETQIAEVSFSIEELRDPEKNYHKMSVAEASELCKFDWDTYFKNYSYDQTTEIDLGQPAPVAKACEILMTAPLEDLKSIFEWCRISGYCSYISDEFVEENFRFNQKLTGVQEQLPRWRRAVYLVDGLMDDAVGQMYVEKYFPAESKQRMLDLVHNLQTVLGERIKAQTWMSEATKQAALEKLGALRIKIGYPDKWEDISGLTVDPKLTLVENIYRIGKFYWNLRKEKRYNKPVDKDEWHVAAQTVNAFYSSTRNEICFPAGILQPPFFSKDFDDAVNYGAIGVVIGHEMTHGFDDQGRKFDKEGNLAPLQRPPVPRRKHCRPRRAQHRFPGPPARQAARLENLYGGRERLHLRAALLPLLRQRLGGCLHRGGTPPAHPERRTSGQLPPRQRRSGPVRRVVQGLRHQGGRQALRRSFRPSQHLVIVIPYKHNKRLQILAGARGGENEIRTRGTLIRFVGLANRWFQPLT